MSTLVCGESAKLGDNLLRDESVLVKSFRCFFFGGCNMSFLCMLYAISSSSQSVSGEESPEDDVCDCSWDGWGLVGEGVCLSRSLWFIILESGLTGLFVGWGLACCWSKWSASAASSTFCAAEEGSMGGIGVEIG